jgi:hypothetical protein
MYVIALLWKTKRNIAINNLFVVYIISRGQLPSTMTRLVISSFFCHNQSNYTDNAKSQFTINIRSFMKCYYPMHSLNNHQNINQS